MQSLDTDLQPTYQHVEILDKADAVVTALEDGEMTATDISDRTGEPISSTYRLINSLLQMEWIMAGSMRGRYRLGLRMLTAGSAFVDSLDLRELLKPSLMEFRDSTMLTVYVCIPSGSNAVCVERLPGHGVRSLDLVLGGHLPLSKGAAPTAILTAMSESDAEEVMQQLELPATERTDLSCRMDNFRKRGFTTSDSDVTRGVAALGVPIRDHSGTVVAALSVGGLRNDVLDRPELGERLVEIGHIGSRLLGWKDPSA